MGISSRFNHRAKLMQGRATHVPVGEDQIQHLEFARDCADAFNATYGNLLVKPRIILCKLAYVDLYHLIIAF